MSQEEISKDGIKTSILSYLSNYSISLLLLLFFLCAYYFPIFNAPLNEKLWFKNHYCIPTEIKVFFLVLALLLTYPIGMLIDAVSWVLLGWIEPKQENWIFKKKIFLSLGTKKYLCFDLLKKHFQLDQNNFYSKCRETEAYLFVHHHELLESLDFSVGCSILLRNLALCLPICSIPFFYNSQLMIGIILILVAVVCLVINSVIAFFHSIFVLLIKYQLETNSTNLK